MVNEINGDLRLLLIVVIVVIVLFILIMLVKVRGGMIHSHDAGHHKGWTKENFDKTPMAQHIEAHYSASERKHNRKIRRAERVINSGRETSLLYVLAKKVIIGNQESLKDLRATKEKEIILAKKVFFSKSHGPRLRGDTISHGIRRHGFGHDRHKHELGGK
jgi:hypothetical protein